MKVILNKGPADGMVLEGWQLNEYVYVPVRDSASPSGLSLACYRMYERCSEAAQYAHVPAATEHLVFGGGCPGEGEGFSTDDPPPTFDLERFDS